jgi:hypothetical protein
VTALLRPVPRRANLAVQSRSGQREGPKLPYLVGVEREVTDVWRLSTAAPATHP